MIKGKIKYININVLLGNASVRAYIVAKAIGSTHTLIPPNRPAESFFESDQETNRDTMNVEVGWCM